MTTAGVTFRIALLVAIVWSVGWSQQDVLTRLPSLDDEVQITPSAFDGLNAPFVAVEL